MLRLKGPSFRSLSSPVRRVHGFVFYIVAPPRSELTTATSTGHHPTPFRHATRTVRGKRKSSHSTFYLGTASSGSSTTPLPVTNLGIAVGHHSSDDESSDRCNLAPQRPPRYQILQFHKKINAPFPRQTAAVKSSHESSIRRQFTPQRPPRYQILQFHKKINSLFPRQTADVKKN
ncbi:hypothetical protein AVEN_194924-1 [Araneus ventricosus]|uniref:Uncharacterized protein n=1 Tax=Araneus ventricosus TaxID=182803 RepID=A0A4Y2B3X2_ARAVE|nr:hypothetical protein AVEN_194924-1 [Araneus ventricosus]